MKYKVCSRLFSLGCVVVSGLSILFGACFIISFYSLVAQHASIMQEISLNLIKNNLGWSIGYCVVACLLCICCGFLGRICHIGVFWSRSHDIEYRNLMFDKKHPTDLAKIKALYPNDIEKWKSYARGEFKENNGINVYNEKLEKHNVQNRLERNPKLSTRIYDFVVRDPFSNPDYRKDTFPEHRSYEEYLQDFEEEVEELEVLRNA